MKNILLGRKPQKPKNPKMEFGFQNLDRKSYMKQEKHIFEGKKGKNKPAELKNRIWAPKLVWEIRLGNSYEARWGRKGLQSPKSAGKLV
jgi:hypothetical protein